MFLSNIIPPLIFALQFMQNIFISNIDSQLGLELIQIFRTDHLQLQGHRQIVGTATSNVYSNAVISHILDFSRSPNLVLKFVLESDLIILDLQTCPAETEFIIKYLTYGNLPRSKKVIGISSYLTWANTPKNPIQEQEKEIDHLEQLKLNLNFRPFVDLQYEKRIPQHKALYSYELENLLISAKTKNQKIQACIVCSGLQYGNSFDSFARYYKQGMFLREGIEIFGEANNKLPMIHVADLAKIIECVCMTQIQKNYVLAVDDSQLTQLQVAQLFVDIFRLPTKKIQLEYATLEQAKFSTNLVFDRSTEFNNLEFEYIKGLQFCKSIIVQQYLKHRQYKSFNIFVPRTKQFIKEATSCVEELKKHYQFLPVLSEEIIDEYLKQIQSKENSDKQLKEQIRIQRQIFQKKHQEMEADKKKKHELENHVFKYSFDLVVMTVKRYLNSNLLGGYILHCQEQFYRSIQKYIEEVNFKIVFTQTEVDSEIIYNSKRYNQLFRNQLNQQPYQQKVQQKKIEETKKQALVNELPRHHNQEQQQIRSIDEINQDKQSNTTNLKQYLMDQIMPTISTIIMQIQEKRPEIIMEYFLEALRRHSFDKTWYNQEDDNL